MVVEPAGEEEERDAGYGAESDAGYRGTAASWEHVESLCRESLCINIGFRRGGEEFRKERWWPSVRVERRGSSGKLGSSGRLGGFFSKESLPLK